ncbi:MAG: hypothetical protein ACI8X5_000442 [Planctomycetota bacterium]|jgi:hypothetical protein
MTFDIIPGNALGCRTNAHRHGWDGSICEDAGDWACGIEADFRQKYCETGTPRCFHLHLFDEEDPYLVIPDSGVGWLLGKHPAVFEDQILLIWAPQAEEPHGMVGGRPVGSFMAGVYRIKEAERVEQRNHVEWKIRPYPDGWAYMGPLETMAPRFIHLGGPYIKQVEGSSLGPLFETAIEAAGEISDCWTQEEKDRLENFASHLDDWLAIAEKRSADFIKENPPAVEPGAEVAKERRTTQPARSERPAPEPELSTCLIPVPPKPPIAEPPATYPLIESSKRKRIEETYGSRSLRSLEIAALTHPMVLLTGHTGVGKSSLALDLIDDPKRERTLVVPVGTDWTGPEQLFGQLSASNGIFEPTRFTNFMRAAELAWRNGDFSTRVVIFENFDNSHPEEWLSEIRTRMQYPADNFSARTIDFGGEAVRGWARGAEPRLLISPAVRFVATLDNPLQADTLTPRLLDDVGIVEITISTADALELSTAKLSSKMIEALVALDKISRPFQAGITFTTANSIAICIDHQEELGIDSWKAIDLVLCQEIVGKLRLLAPQGLGEQVGHRLVTWAEGTGKKFIEASAHLSAFGEQVSRASLSGP